MANYEAFRQRRQVQAIYSVPTAAMQGGNFSGLANVIYDPATRVKNADGTVTATPFAGNVIPATRIDSDLEEAAGILSGRQSHHQPPVQQLPEERRDAPSTRTSSFSAWTFRNRPNPPGSAVIAGAMRTS